MGAEQHTGIERRYDVPADVLVPQLHRLPCVAPPETLALEATYFGTSSRALTRAGITLRGRTGGQDDGWHLELPASRDRPAQVCLSLPEQNEQAPAELVARVRALTGSVPFCLDCRRRFGRAPYAASRARVT